MYVAQVYVDGWVLGTSYTVGCQGGDTAHHGVKQDTDVTMTDVYLKRRHTNVHLVNRYETIVWTCRLPIGHSVFRRIQLREFCFFLMRMTSVFSLHCVTTPSEGRGGAGRGGVVGILMGWEFLKIFRIERHVSV